MPETTTNVDQNELDAHRLKNAKVKIGEVIESGSLDDYPKGQLGAALRIVEKYENLLKGRGESD